MSAPLDTIVANGWPRNTGRFKKKPVSIYAAQWNPKAKYWPPSVYQRGYSSYVRTANGDIEIQTGTWICWQRVKGKLDVWPVAAAIFEATYERAL